MTNQAKRIFFLAGILAAVLIACVAKRGVMPAWPQFTEQSRKDPSATVEALNKRNYAWQNVQARVSFRVEGVNPQSPELKGDLLIHPPSDVRLRTYTPFGTIAFDLLYKGPNIELYLPHRREVVIVSIEQLKTLSFGGTPLTLPRAQDWLRIIQPWEGQKENEHYTLEPSNTLAKGILNTQSEQILFSWDSGRIEQLTLENGYVLNYSQWDFFDARELAKKIDLTPDNSKIKLRLDLQEVHDSPSLPPQAFESVDMSHLKVTRLHK